MRQENHMRPTQRPNSSQASWGASKALLKHDSLTDYWLPLSRIYTHPWPQGFSWQVDKTQLKGAHRDPLFFRDGPKGLRLFFERFPEPPFERRVCLMRPFESEIPGAWKPYCLLYELKQVKHPNSKSITRITFETNPRAPSVKKLRLPAGWIGWKWPWRQDLQDEIRFPDVLSFLRQDSFKGHRFENKCGRDWIHDQWLDHFILARRGTLENVKFLRPGDQFSIRISPHHGFKVHPASSD